jgi:hypothetical protein
MIYTLIGSIISIYFLSTYFAEKIKSNKVNNLNSVSVIEILIFAAMVTQASIFLPIIQSFFK